MLPYKRIYLRVKDNTLLKFREIRNGEYFTIPPKIENIVNKISRKLELDFDSISTTPVSCYHGSRCYIFLKPTRVTFYLRDNTEVIEENYNKKMILILNDEFDNFFKIKFSHHPILLFRRRRHLLKKIYLRKNHRMKLRKLVRDKLAALNISSSSLSPSCILERFDNKELLGKGDFGNVFKVQIEEIDFAVKVTRITPEAYRCPNNKNYSSWFEVLIMRHLLNPLIRKNITPNLPFLIDSFFCKDCHLRLRKVNENHPCSILVTELANGTFRDYLKKYNPSVKELYSALFQIVSALHVVQMNGQILNFDVKADNILFYNVEPGGYWTYIVHDITFYVPNYGKLFILNDFGISRPMSPDFQLYRQPNDETFRLGSRYAYIRNGKFIPLNSNRDPDHKGKRYRKAQSIHWSNGKTSRGTQYRLIKKSQIVLNNKTEISQSAKEFLSSKGIEADSTKKEFFLFPEVIPPFEFYNDLQDCIRIFIGGKRTTQNGNHKKYPVVKANFLKKLRKYNGIGASMDDCYFSTNPSQILAGYFIENFFTYEYDYTKKPKGKQIGNIYSIS